MRNGPANYSILSFLAAIKNLIDVQMNEWSFFTRVLDKISVDSGGSNFFIGINANSSIVA